VLYIPSVVHATVIVMARGRNSTATGVRFNDGLLLQLKKLARSQGLTTNEFIVLLVEHGLECSEHQVVEHRVVWPKPVAVGVVGRELVQVVAAGRVTRMVKAKGVRRE